MHEGYRLTTAGEPLFVQKSEESFSVDPDDDVIIVAETIVGVNNKAREVISKINASLKNDEGAIFEFKSRDGLSRIVELKIVKVKLHLFGTLRLVVHIHEDDKAATGL